MSTSANRPKAYQVSMRRARKAHRCSACEETIPRGHVYSYTFGVWDGNPDAIKRCLKCEAIYEHLLDVCDSDEPPACYLDCGHSYEDVHDEPPPDWLVGVAMSTPGEMQALHALEEAMCLFERP